MNGYPPPILNGTEMRDHEPIVIQEFNGLWRRGDPDATPPDHFVDCNNIKFKQGGVLVRDGLDTFLPIPNVLRSYTFVQESGQSELILDSDGNLYDSTYYPTPILTIATMTDFSFVSIAGRAYITPCDSETGLDNEFVYVYKGDGTAARKAAGEAPVDSPDGQLTVANSATTGTVEAGYHIFAVVYETDTGFLTSLGPTFKALLAPGAKKVDLTNMPVSPNSYVINKHICSTKAIAASFYTGNVSGYNFYFIPGAVFANATLTGTVDFYDADLLESASHLQDLFEEIPAGVGLGTYHSRMLVYGTFDDISVCYVSMPGEPEAISQVDGLIIVPLDGNPLTNAQEFRDVLYLFKQTRTVAYNDNGDVPSAWLPVILDQGIGAPLHGISTVLDSGGVNIDYLVIANPNGIILFNGAYTHPELSWKINDFWLEIDFGFYRFLQIINDSLNEVLYVVLDTGDILVGDYGNGLDPKNIRWVTWEVNMEVTTIAIINTNQLIMGSDKGVYFLNPGKLNDTIYTFPGPASVEVMIPNPFIETYFVGD